MAFFNTLVAGANSIPFLFVWDSFIFHSFTVMNRLQIFVCKIVFFFPAAVLQTRNRLQILREIKNSFILQRKTDNS